MSVPALRGFAQGKPASTLLSLLALLICFRALVPVGYMPDAGALRQGRLEISFCSAAGGPPTVLRALIDTPRSGEHPQDATAQECPYWMLAHLALDMPPASHAAVLPALPATRPDTPVTSVRPPLPAAGPPLGPRAPPVLFS